MAVSGEVAFMSVSKWKNVMNVNYVTNVISRKKWLSPPYGII